MSVISTSALTLGYFTLPFASALGCPGSCLMRKSDGSVRTRPSVTTGTSSARSISFLKVATYRVAAYLDTFAVQTFFTASPGQGVAVASVHAVAKPVIAYANEIFWAQSGHGKAPAALLSANFPEISSDQ